MPCRSAKRCFLRMMIPNPDLFETADVRQHFEMSRGLHAGAEQRQHLRVRRGQRIRRHRGNGRGPHFGDVTSIHERQWFAGFRIEQRDDRHVRRQFRARIVRIERHHLYSHRIARRRHDAEEAAVLREHTTQRLFPFSRRELRQHPAHCLDQLVDAKQPPNLLFLEVFHQVFLLTRRSKNEKTARKRRTQTRL